ncbi:MAG: DMT family transporter [Pseudomonadota bacterium]
MMSDRPLLGILLMLGFCLLAPLGDGLAKFLSGTIAVGVLVTVRFAVQFLVLLPLALRTAGTVRLTARILRLTAWRTALHILGISAMFLALSYLPLADAIAIAFVMPFIMLVLGHVVLGEAVGPWRVLGCAIGFLGTLMVVQPSFAQVGAPALLPVFVAVVFALFMLVTRKLAKDIDPISLQCLSGGMACAVLLPLLLIGHAMGTESFSFLLPGALEAALLLGLGILGTAAHLLMTWSLRYAPAATLAPMQYLEIPFATLIGWLIFGDLPNGLAALGICVTISAGLFVIYRERLAAKEA